MTDTMTYAVIAASLRGERMGRVLADWAAARMPATTDLIDLAEVTLPDDESLRPGGGPGTEISDRIAEARAATPRRTASARPSTWPSVN